jgi:hypothetical protein
MNIGLLVHPAVPAAKSNPFTDALLDFFEPRAWIGAMNDPAQKAQPLGCIVAVSSDVVLCDLGIHVEKALHASGFGEGVWRVAQLRNFDQNRSLNVEDVFISKQVDSARPAGELVG